MAKKRAWWRASKRRCRARDAAVPRDETIQGAARGAARRLSGERCTRTEIHEVVSAALAEVRTTLRPDCSSPAMSAASLPPSSSARAAFVVFGAAVSASSTCAQLGTSLRPVSLACCTLSLRWYSAPSIACSSSSCLSFLLREGPVAMSTCMEASSGSNHAGPAAAAAVAGGCCAEMSRSISPTSSTSPKSDASRSRTSSSKRRSRADALADACTSFRFKRRSAPDNLFVPVFLIA